MTMRERWESLDENTVLTAEHQADYEFLQNAWKTDCDSLFVWQMRYFWFLRGAIVARKVNDGIDTKRSPAGGGAGPDLPEGVRGPVGRAADAASE